LAPINAADRIVPALAEALVFPLETGTKLPRSARLQVFDYLRARRLMLVLDNVEHLLSDTTERADDAGELITALLDAAPGLAILATSRERLRLREECVYPLGGLDLPEAEVSSSSGAVVLFIQRARLLQPQFVPANEDFATVARICRLVDGMPLAIELAAGWVDTLALTDITTEIARGLDLLATELRDMPERHRNMRVVFDAS
jgi:predicted ATPase